MIKRNLFICTTAIAILSLGIISNSNAAVTKDVAADSSKIQNVVSDTAITAAIKTKFLADDLVKSHTISVETINGLVTLTGNVDSQDVENKALSIAKNTNGVKEVVAKLTIGKIEQADQSKMNNIISDSAITTEVKSKFIADDLVKTLDIHVETVNGVVTLKGKVPSQEVMDRAQAIVKGVAGVQNVKNELGLK